MIKQKAKEPSREAATLRRELEVARRPSCVLVAEDDDDIRALLVATLRRDGYEVIEARNGVELLDHVGASMLFGESYPPPDLILSDIRMAGVTGLEVLAGLRDANWHTPVVLISAYGCDETFDEAARLGADAFFDKPLDMDDLRNAIRLLMPADVWSRRAGPEPDRKEAP